MAKTKTYHRRHKKSRKSSKKTRRYSRKQVKRGGGAGNPFAIDQFNSPLTYSGNAGWYGPYPRASDQILYQLQSPRMPYNRNLSLANESIPGVNVAMTKPLKQNGGKIPLYRQGSTVLGDSELSEFYPGPTHY